MLTFVNISDKELQITSSFVYSEQLLPFAGNSYMSLFNSRLQVSRWN